MRFDWQVARLNVFGYGVALYRFIIVLGSSSPTTQKAVSIFTFLFLIFSFASALITALVILRLMAT